MIRLLRPSPNEIAALLKLPDEPFNHSEVGATADADSLAALSPDYALARHCFPLGAGRDRFERARASLFAWCHFDIPWLALHGAAAPAAVGQVVATSARVLGLWFVNRCRVVYTEGASGPCDEAAFAYGTLSHHVLRGEERFSVHFDAATQEVTYQILAFSRPAGALARIGRPQVGRVQARFATSSAEALLRACTGTSA